MEATANDSSSTTYDEWIRKILNVDVLAEAVEEMQEDYKCLNLVSPDWKERIANDPIVQRFANKNGRKIFTDVRIQNDSLRAEYIHDSNFTPNVLVVGRWRMIRGSYHNKNAEQYSIYVMESPALVEIVRFMTSDCDENVERIRKFKFGVHQCSPGSCSQCKWLMERLRKQKVQVPMEHQWCVEKTKVFDGKSISNAFRSLVEKDMAFVDSVIAVMNVKLDRRFLYKRGDAMCVKVGGFVTDQIVLKVDNLKRRKELKISDSYINMLVPLSDDPAPSNSRARDDPFGTTGSDDDNERSLVRKLTPAPHHPIEDCSNGEWPGGDVPVAIQNGDAPETEDDVFGMLDSTYGKHKLEDDVKKEEEECVDTVPFAVKKPKVGIEWNIIETDEFA